MGAAKLVRVSNEAQFLVQHVFNLSDRANQLNFVVALPMSGPAPFGGGGDFDDGRRVCGAKCDVNECLALLTHIARVERGQSSHRITGWRSHLDRGEGGREQPRVRLPNSNIEQTSVRR